MNEVVAFARIFVESGVSPEDAGAALVRLRRSAALVQSVTSVIEQFPLIHQEPDQAGRKRFFRQPEIQNIIDLAVAVGHRDVQFLRLVQSVYTEEQLNPAPFLRGNHLIELGLTPGPRFARILFALETEQLNGNVTNVFEALVFVEEFEDE